MDYANLLKAEIAKKQKAVTSSKYSPETTRPPQTQDAGNGLASKASQSVKTQDIHEPKPPLEHGMEEVPREQEVSEITEKKLASSVCRLRTRPGRIARTLADEREVDTTISATEIGDVAQEAELSLKCNLFIHRLLKLWQEECYRPELILETKKALYPLVLKLRKRHLPSEFLTSLATIFYHTQQRQFPQATQSYMKLSIGNVAWPIGVTSVGIHARSAHERIQGKDKIANVMLDEHTRLWITSVKRLITFAEALERRKKSQHVNE
ncbi:LAQU0S07e02432g1_1 [Lachancea quebecensis]|uniref:Pre-mRNA-splicing factor 18 n=1 Tax=Lachancea quebecensis TaxID=1654605 RepID=A0A0N7MLP8_9SACH|nr:LAQU0S07e02432g1_1 [Lachancea quebecensis]